MDDPLCFQRTLSEKLSESLSTPVFSGTSRRVHGTVHPGGKATAVVGMCLAGSQFPQAHKRLLTLTRMGCPGKPLQTFRLDRTMSGS